MHTDTLAPIFQQIVNPLLIDLLQGLALAVVTWVAYLIKTHAPPFIAGWLETKASTDLNTALQNGVHAIMTKTNAWESVHSDVELQDTVTAWAAQYAIDHAGGAVARFGLSPEQLATKALAFIPAPPAAAASVTLPSGATVTLGKPSPAGQTETQEVVETAALNRSQPKA